jgi:hypothetical protein
MCARVEFPLWTSGSTFRPRAADVTRMESRAIAGAIRKRPAKHQSPSRSLRRATMAGHRRDHDGTVGSRRLLGLPRGTAPAATTAAMIDVPSPGAPGAVTPSPTTLSGRRGERRWGLRLMAGKIFLIVNNFCVRVRHPPLEVSWRGPPGEGHHDDKCLQQRVGAVTEARLPRPGAFRQRPCHPAARERPSRTRRAYSRKGLSTVPTAEPLDHPLATPTRGGAALPQAGVPPAAGRSSAVQWTTRRNFDRQRMKNHGLARGGGAMQGAPTAGRSTPATRTKKPHTPPHMTVKHIDRNGAHLGPADAGPPGADGSTRPSRGLSPRALLGGHPTASCRACPPTDTAPAQTGAAPSAAAVPCGRADGQDLQRRL